jgi:hypothetical protein
LFREGEQKNNSPTNEVDATFQRSQSQNDLDRPLSNVQSSDPVVRSYDDSSGYRSPDKVRRNTRNVETKQWQRHSLDDIDAPRLKGNRHLEGKQQQASKPSVQSRNNREDPSVQSREPWDAGAVQAKMWNPLPLTTDESKRSRDNLVDTSVLSGGRPSVSRNDSKNQDIINWLGVSSSSSADVGTDFNYEDDAGQRVRPQGQNQPVGRSFPAENFQNSVNQFSLDAHSGRQNNVRNAESFPLPVTRQDMHPGVDHLKTISHGVENPLYDINRRQWGSDNSLNSSSSAGDKDERGMPPRLREPTSLYYQQTGQDRRGHDRQGDTQGHNGLRVVEFGAGYGGKQNYDMGWAQSSPAAEGQITTSGYHGEQSAEIARPPPKPAHFAAQTYRQMTGLQAGVSDMSIRSERNDSSAANQSKQDVPPVADVVRSPLFGQNYATVNHDLPPDVTSSRRQNQLVEDDVRNDADPAKHQATECEYAVVQKRKGPSQFTFSSNVQNNNTQDQVDLEGQKNMASLSIRGQQPPIKYVDASVNPKQANDAGRFGQLSALSKDQDTQLQVDAAPLRPPLPAVGLFSESSRNAYTESRDAAADDGHRMVIDD